MEQILQKIQEGFLRETSVSSENIKQRIAEFNEYLKLLGSVSVEISNISAQYKKDIYNLIQEKVSHEKALTDINDSHAKEIKNHVEKKTTLEVHLDNINNDIIAKEKKIESLDSKVKGLVIEITNDEAMASELRGAVSTLERAVSTLKAEEVKLSTSISKLKEEEGTITGSIESKKKESGRLSDDIAILNSRK